jgi:Rhodopirellula transposase DDE domain
LIIDRTGQGIKPSCRDPFERCWAALENYWNGGILDSVEAAILWASNMTWQGLKPIVHCVETICEKGIKVLPDELEKYKAN